MKKLMTFFCLSTLLFVQGTTLNAQIPASELPPAGTDTGLEGKYDPQNGIAQLIKDKSAESAASKIFEDDRVLVFMPLPEEEVVAPGHVLVVPKRLGARNLLDLKPDEMGYLLLTVQKAAIAQKNGLGQPVFEFNKITGSAVAKPFAMLIFTSYPLMEEKRLERPRQGESYRRRNIKR